MHLKIIVNQICQKTLIFFLIIISYSTPVHAQSAGLSISPPVTEILLAPGKKVIQTVEVKNQGSTTEFTVNFHLVSPADEFGHTKVDPQPLDPSSIPLLLTLENADIKLGQSFTLNSGNSRQIVIGIEGSSTDLTQDTYFAVVVSPSNSPLEGSASAVSAISSLFLVTLTPDGAIPVNLNIEGFDLPWLLDSSDQLQMQAKIVNGSSNMIRPKGQLAVLSPRGHHDDDYPLFSNLVLGQSSRQIMLQDNEGLPLPLAWTPTWRNIGPYRLRLTLTTPGGTKIHELEKTIWVLPIKLSILVLLIVVFGSISLYMKTNLAKRQIPLDRVSEKT